MAELARFKKDTIGRLTRTGLRTPVGTALNNTALPRTEDTDLSVQPSAVAGGIRPVAPVATAPEAAPETLPVAGSLRAPAGFDTQPPPLDTDATATTRGAVDLTAQTGPTTGLRGIEHVSQAVTPESPTLQRSGPFAAPEVTPLSATGSLRAPREIEAPALAEQAVPAVAPEAVGIRSFVDTGGGATPRTVQRPVLDIRQVRDPVTGLDDPQIVDTGRTKTMYIGKDGREYETATLASQADTALAEAGKTTAEAGEVAANAASLRAYRAAQAGESLARTEAAGQKAKAPVVK